jgi:hypothetical protein
MSLASGCTVSPGAYCTVWAQDANGFDRYLPYTQSNGAGQAGWNWDADWLGTGEWLLKARSGDAKSSTPYMLFSK